MGGHRAHREWDLLQISVKIEDIVCFPAILQGYILSVISVSSVAGALSEHRSIDASSVLGLRHRPFLPNDEPELLDWVGLVSGPLLVVPTVHELGLR
jgi:hypothetical protein